MFVESSSRQSLKIYAYFWLSAGPKLKIQSLNIKYHAAVVAFSRGGSSSSSDTSSSATSSSATSSSATSSSATSSNSATSSSATSSRIVNFVVVSRTSAKKILFWLSASTKFKTTGLLLPLAEVVVVLVVVVVVFY